MYQNHYLTNESYVLALIEEFLINTSQEEHLLDQEEFKQELLELITSFKPIYKNHLWYSSSIRVFREVIVIVDYILDKFGSDVYQSILKFEQHHIHHIQGWIKYSMRYAQQQIRWFKSQEKANQLKMEWYLTQLTNHYSKLLFVRVDLGILQENQHLVSIEDFKVALNQVLNRIGNQDTCFQDLQGYAWALEQGETKGYHCHLLLIYDGNKHQNDFGLGQLVGQCWKKITNEMGFVFNCNSPEHKAKFEANGMLGIGMIYRDNPQQVANAIRTAKYLVNPEKTNQHLRVKTSAQMKTFGMGRFDVWWRRGI